AWTTMTMRVMIRKETNRKLVVKEMKEVVVAVAVGARVMKKKNGTEKVTNREMMKGTMISEMRMKLKRKKEMKASMLKPKKHTRKKPIMRSKKPKRARSKGRPNPHQQTN